MKRFGLRLAATSLVCCAAALNAGAQGVEKPAFLDTNLPVGQRAADLVKRMTLEEKASQLVNQARAIPRLNVPSYDWWSESLHGVATNGTTEFPEPVGLASTFDPAAIQRMGEVIGTEGRIKYMQAVRTNGGYSNIFEGLDFWAPNINIFRDPRWGRGQETYGEDPFLTARMGVAFVKGMQGDDPKYYRVIATPKHYAVHSGPEPTRHFTDIDISKHDEMDTYLPAFRAAITEGKAESIMCAYNAINGEPACASSFLLVDQLRQKWGFNGYVVSDCGAVRDIYSGHRFRQTQAEASAISVQRGMDNECIDFRAKVLDDHDYRPYIDAVKQGVLKESEIDTALVRLFTARMRLGMFDPPEMVPYTKIDEKELDSPEHRAMALKVANESMVLLKNDGVLPIKAGKKIAVIGPLANQTRVLLGNYNGIPTHTVSILEGLKKEFAGATINFVPGTGFLSKETQPVPNAVLTTDGKPGAKVIYLNHDIVSEEITTSSANLNPVATRVEPGIDIAAQPLPAEAANIQPLAIRWEATLTPKETGDYLLGVQTDAYIRLVVDGKPVVRSGYPHGVEDLTGQVHLEAGHPYSVMVSYQKTYANPTPHMHFIWGKIDRKVDPAAIEAAKKADVVVAVVGITSELEGEEMTVNEPGFIGGDRTSIDLPKPEEDLLQALAGAGKPVVVVLTNGSALAINWAKEHSNAILEAWYPGEEGGTAVAQTLSGKNNPAGRLPVTFYTGVDQLPHFEDYAMKGRTYRYFNGTPLFPFGYGLSYTTFSYSDIKLPGQVAAGSNLMAEASVTNTGKVAGDEVVQLYLTFPKVEGAPLKALRGFQRIHLEPGAKQTVKFELNPRDMSMVTERGDPVVSEGAYTLSIGGGQPGTSAPIVTGNFSVQGTQKLPE